MRLFKQFLLGTVFATAALLPFGAQALSLRDAVKVAIETNPEIGQAIANREATEWELQQALALYGPRLDLEASDGAMVARGDLAVEVGDAAVPAMQKRIIRVSREMNKLVITATQMMESMISSPVPTRAEVSDVANAVLDGTDAVMLSAETASGQYPVETVEAMSRICIEAEKSAEVKLDQEFLQRVFTRIDQSIAMAALFSAFHLKVKAIATLTQSGSTSLWMSRLNSGVPIYALTPEVRTRYKLSMYRGVTPLMIKLDPDADRDRMLLDAEAELLRSGAVKVGDLIVLSFGEPIGVPGGTNTLKIVKVGEYRQLSTVI